MALLTREDLLKKDELQVDRVDFPDGDHVFVRQMAGRERDRFEQSLISMSTGEDGQTSYEQNSEDFRAKLAVHTVCDEEGNLLLKPEDYPVMSQAKSADKLERIVNKAQKLNNISQRDRENLTKNSESAQSGASTSDSAES